MKISRVVRKLPLLDVHIALPLNDVLARVLLRHGPREPGRPREPPLRAHDRNGRTLLIGVRQTLEGSCSAVNLRNQLLRNHVQIPNCPEIEECRRYEIELQLAIVCSAQNSEMPGNRSTVAQNSEMPGIRQNLGRVKFRNARK